MVNYISVHLRSLIPEYIYIYTSICQIYLYSCTNFIFSPAVHECMCVCVCENVQDSEFKAFFVKIKLFYNFVPSICIFDEYLTNFSGIWIIHQQLENCLCVISVNHCILDVHELLNIYKFMNIWLIFYESQCSWINPN